MASTAQVIANQRNALASTGPATQEGKANSARNAQRHGLCAAFTILPHEDREAFDLIVASHLEQFQPEGLHETFLVECMVQDKWRLTRIERLEAEAYEEVLTGPGPADRSPDGRILAAIAAPGNPFDKLQRYRAAAERSYYKAHRELQQSRGRNQKAEASALDHYIKKVVFAPMPGAALESKEQNEPNSAGRQSGKAVRNAESLGNPALRL